MSEIRMVPIGDVRVINSRSRNRLKFNEIVENIARVGLKKPITVSSREDKSGFDLVCGEGRLEAYRAKGAREIPAIVLDIPLEERLLRSLVENLTRRAVAGVELARELVNLKQRGLSQSAIADQTGLSETYVSQLLKLMAKGEERLVAAVEKGDLPINVAIEIASASDTDLQNALQEAYDQGDLRGRDLAKVRKVIEARRKAGKDLRIPPAGKSPKPHDLVRTLRRETAKQELLVKKSRLCEEHLRFVTTAMKTLMSNDQFVTIIRAEKIDKMPKYLNERVKQ